MAKDNKQSKSNTEEGGKIKKKKTSKRWEDYEVSGSELKRKNRFCPKCGDGIFLANHKSRQSCGACGYTEMTTK